MPNDAGLCIAVDVGLPLPARRVRVPGTDVLGLEALKLLLRSEFVGLDRAWVSRMCVRERQRGNESELTILSCVLRREAGGKGWASGEEGGGRVASEGGKSRGRLAQG